MNIGEILVANGASILLLVILLMCRHMTRRSRRAVDMVFSAIIVIGIAGSILEPLTFLLDGKEGDFLRGFNFFANTLEYLCTATVAVLWIWYVDLSLNHDIKRMKIIAIPTISLWGIMVLFLIGNIFGEYLFSIDEKNVYARQPLGYVIYIFLVGSYVTSIVLYCKFRVVHGKAQFFPIWMFLTPLVIAIGIQIPFYGISVAYLGCSIGLVGIYLNLQSKRSLVDGLTGLYNRGYIEHSLVIARSSKRFVYGGIMLDVDNFKQINDTFGHSVGDHALADAAKILINATDRDSLAFRFAGDEFIVLVRTPIGKADELDERTLAVEERIRAEAEKFNHSDIAPYKIDFSMGHALYDTALADDDFFHDMDVEMYKDKQLHHMEG